MRLAPRILGQSAAIILLSGALAFGVNALRPDGLPLARAAKALPAPSAVQPAQAGAEIALKDAALLYLSGRAVFLDARSQFEFELGHIRGAINLSPREFASRFQDVKPLLQGKEAVITYCDGAGCPLSDTLAGHLRAAGIANVFVLKNGWSLWQAEKLPVAKGPEDTAQQGQNPPGQAVKAAQTPKAPAGPARAAIAPTPRPDASARSDASAKAAPSGKPSAKPSGLRLPGEEKLCTDCAN